MAESACGIAGAALGSFYYPVERKVSPELSFFTALRERFRTPGDFGQASVIAREVGHHGQNLLGISQSVSRRRCRRSATAQLR
jgi:predicted metalloprotease